MDNINKRLRNLFLFALLLSIGLPIGILCIIFGASNSIIPLLVIGIILAVAGFYIMPILWVAYASARNDLNILRMIENSYIYTVKDIATQTGYTETHVRERIMKMIAKHELNGYIFKDDTLYINTNQKQTETNSHKTVVCDRCGAVMTYNGLVYHCEYCGNIVND